MSKINSFFLILFPLLLFSCAHEDACVQIVIDTEKTIAWNEAVACTVQNADIDYENLVWYVDGLEFYTSSPNLVLQTCEREKRYSISAAFKDGTASTCNELVIYNTQHYDSLKACYDFIDKYNIQTAIAVSMKTKEDTFDFYTGYASLKDKTFCSDESLFYYYSITKTFVSALICTLAEEGYINLNDKVSDILDADLFDPEFINLNATIRQLLSHRSGIGEYVTNYKIFLNNPFLTQKWTPEKILEFVENPVLAEDNYVYSSANYILLGMIAEKVTGKKLNELLNLYFLEPLTLEAISLSPQDSINYSLMTHPHLLANTQLNLGNSKGTVDLTSIFQGPVMELIGKSSWAGGGLAGNSKNGAAWIYELFSDSGRAVSESVREMMLRSTENAYPGCEELMSFGICGRRIFYKGDSFVGSYGRSVGSNNLAFYNKSCDCGFCILTTTNSDANGNPDVYELLCKLYDTIQE